MERLTKREGKHCVRIGNEWRRHDAGWNKLAEYEDLEEQGLILRLPVAEGSLVFTINSYYDCKYNYNCILEDDGYKCDRCEHEYRTYAIKEIKFNRQMIDKIGKTIFLTKKEANIKLKELKGE